MPAAILEPEEQVLSTLERSGRRRWLYPRLSPGRLWRARRAVAYALIAFFVALPYVRINGKPSVLLDIPARRFTFFGTTFLPTDTALLALLLVGWFLGIFLITALVGRVWCGWACPHTVYLEFVFRPIERLFEGTRGRGGKSFGKVAPWRKAAKWACYVAAAAAVAHVFLSYFVGVDRLAVWVRQSPFDHPVPFLVMVAAVGLMLLNFTWFREQMCLIACPYGRFQSVLLDRQSLIVAYDVGRGEQRGKLRKVLPILPGQGDCVDCGACVRTCPTGIDIRNGLQMECVNCTQCIDACNAIMDRIGKPRGLVRYSSQAAIEGDPSRGFRARVVLYPLALSAVGIAFLVLLFGRDSFDATLLRNVGSPFTVAPDGQVRNSFRLKIVNRGEETVEFSVFVPPAAGLTIAAGGEPFQLPPGEAVTRPILISAPRSLFQFGAHELPLKIRDSLGEEKVITCRLLGPFGAAQ